MGKLRRWAAAALCGAVFAGGVLAVAAACACLLYTSDAADE